MANLSLTQFLLRPLEIDSDDSIEEFEDAINADEDIFAEPVPQNRLKYLSKLSLPVLLFIELIAWIFLLVEDHTEEEILGCLQFVNNYRDRYGDGPNFFEGTLEDAVKAACSTKSVKDVKPCTASRNFTKFLFQF